MLKKITEPYVVGVASRIFGQLISFIAVAVASRYLDLEVFGTFALAWAVTVIFNTFVFTGFYQALLRSHDLDRDRDTLFWLNVAVGGTGLAVILTLGLVSGGLETARGFALVALSPISILIVGTAWWEAQLVHAKRVRAASLYVLVCEVFGLAVAVAMLLNGWQIEALIASRYVSTGVGLVLTGGLVRRLPRFSFRRATVRSAAGTALPLWGTTSVSLFSNYGADLTLGAFAGTAVVGAYRGGARIAMTASDLVLQPLSMLSWSRFTRLEKEGGDIAELRMAWIENMSIGAAILWPMVATVALLAPILVSTILDEAWLAATGVVTILSMSRGFELLGALLEPTMMTTGNGRIQLIIRTLGAASLLLLLFIFARYGAEAAAFAHLGSAALVGTIALLAIKRVLKIDARQLVATFLPGGILAALTVVAILATEGPRSGLSDGLGLLLTLSAAGVVWTATMAVFLRRKVLVLPKP